MNRSASAWFVTLATLLILPSSPREALAARALGDLTGPWQLFVDDYAVASRTRASRKYYAFKKHEANPIIVPDRPWEKDVVSVTTVLPNEDGTGYRMWYYCWADRKKDKRGSYECYATSKDGITWEKPDLGLAEGPDGTKKNNIVPGSGASIMHTPWMQDPNRKYHSVTGGQYFASASPDGLHWTRLSDEKIVGGGDVGWFRWDPHRERFMGFVKVGSVVSGLSRRSVGFTESRDLTSFPSLIRIMAPDDFDDRWTKKGTVQRTHFYGCPFFPYESMYIGVLWIFRAVEEEEGYFHGPIFNELVTSHDGFHWQRQEGDRTPILDVGKPPRSWDQGMIAGMSLIRVGDTLRLYFAGYDGPHDYLPFHSGIGLATLRKDGFASLDAGDGPGEVLTKRLKKTRGPLHVNYRANGGSIRVEVLDADGKVIPGFGRDDCDALTADKVDQVVTWKGKEAWPEGVETLRVRFLLQNASLYSFMAGDELQVVEEEPGLVKPQMLYTFEGEWADAWRDRLWADDTQRLEPMGTAKLDRDASHAAKDKMSLAFGSPWRPLHRLRIHGSANLGRHFTLALFAKSSDNKPARLFSAYNGNYPVNTSELVFDCDPQGKAPAGLRLYCQGIPVESQPVQFADSKYHHLGVTYDDGHVRFYLDGKGVGEEWLPNASPVTLCRDVMVGEDLELGTDEQLRGNLDDILVLGRTLSAAEMAALFEKGGQALVGKDGSFESGGRASSEKP